MVFSLSVNVDKAYAHGNLLTPAPRPSAPGVDITTHQDDPTKGPCKSDGYGPVTVAFTPNQAVTFTWRVSEAYFLSFKNMYTSIFYFYFLFFILNSLLYQMGDY